MFILTIPMALGALNCWNKHGVAECDCVPAYLTVNDYDDVPLVASAVITDYYGNQIPEENAAMSLTVRSELAR